MPNKQPGTKRFRTDTAINLSHSTRHYLKQERRLIVHIFSNSNAFEALKRYT